MTSSCPSRCASFASAAFSSGRKTTWVSPSRSRRSIKITPPRSRVMWTHPASVAAEPTSLLRNSLQWWVRYMSVKRAIWHAELRRGRSSGANTGDMQRRHHVQQSLIVLDADDPARSNENVIRMRHFQNATATQFDSKRLKRHRPNPFSKFLKHGAQKLLLVARE